jgi:c-di-GMP-binding flagellar brake protein YcgR
VIVEVHIMGESSLNILRARDISPSGVGVRAAHGFSAGDLGVELDLVIALPQARSFSARGIVRHRNDDATGGFFGVEFTDIRSGDRDAIRRFIDQLPGGKGAAADDQLP